MTALALAILISGWLLVIATLTLLHPGVARNAFIVAALAVEGLGITMLARANMASRADRG